MSARSGVGLAAAGLYGSGVPSPRGWPALLACRGSLPPARHSCFFPASLPSHQQQASAVCQTVPGVSDFARSASGHTSPCPAHRFVEAAKSLARLVTEEELAAGMLYPPVSAAPDVAVHVAAAVAGKAYSAGIATELPKPHDLIAKAASWRWAWRGRGWACGCSAPDGGGGGGGQGPGHALGCSGPLRGSGPQRQLAQPSGCGWPT